MKTLMIAALMTCCGLSLARADYYLQPEQDRVVLLLDLNTVKLDKRGLVFPVGNTNMQLRVDRVWMQARIWSDGICVGVKNEDSRSAESRIVAVQNAIAARDQQSLLVECVWPEGGNAWLVTYLRLFVIDAEYPKYFPKRQFNDTIQFPETMQPKDGADFVKTLKELSEQSLKKLKAGAPTIPSTEPSPARARSGEGGR